MPTREWTVAFTLGFVANYWYTRRRQTAVARWAARL